MKSIMNFAWIVTTLFGFSVGCGTMGVNFEEKRVAQIQTGSTKKEDIRKLFGKPFRTGIENGREVWIYEHSAYSKLGPDSSKDLIVVFDYQGKVYSYQVMSSP